MAGPSSSPRGEHTPRPGTTWETALRSTGEQLVVDDAPTPRANRATRRAAAKAARKPSTYWENRGPRDWQPVELVTRYGPGRGDQAHPLPHVDTKPAGPRNIAVRRGDGTVRVVPVRTLRKERPC